MCKMLRSSIILSSCCFGMVFSLPIKSLIVVERSTIILGFISCLSIGALLGACLFCKRRKRKFELNNEKDLEKFENEAIPSEQASINRTEYPIFRALNTSSPEIGRIPVAIVPQTPNHRSSDNLLDNDNNNGIISQTDLENIQNNNAIEYIPAVAVQEQQQLQQNVNELIIENEIRSVQLAPDNTNDVLPLDVVLDSSLSDTNFLLENNKIEELDGDCSLTSVSILMPPDDEIIDPFGDINFNLSSHNISKEQIEEVIVQTTIANVSEKNPFSGRIKQLSEDTSSVTSISTESSHEFNSVEEALRALDIAIEGEDVSPDEPINSLDYNVNDLLDVMVQEIKNECLEGSHKYMPVVLDKPDLENIRQEAEQLVDEVLEKCQNVLESMEQMPNKQCETSAEKEKTNFTFIMPLPPSTVKAQSGLENDEELFEDFSSQILDCTSTPAHGIGNKFVSYRPDQSSESSNQVVQKLNFGIESSPLVANNCTFEIPSDPVATSDGTFDVPKPLSESPQKSSSPPLIKIDKEDTNSDGATSLPGTVTPVNTPNELMSETWNKIVAKNLMKNRPADADLDVIPITDIADFDKTFDTEKSATGGWFLHPQIPKVDDLDDNTYELGTCEQENEDVDDRDRSIEALRQHLTATLSCTAPTAAVQGPHEYSDDEDASGASDKVPSDHFGIKYGDVDEATNIPAQPVINKAEIVLNYNKRSLSPIMEESEDETCKTFVFNNETRCMDSTSTGCVESEAIMGVTKTLMASNDTLFNFEDTLVDENIFSPRAQSQNEERPTLDFNDIPFAMKYPLEKLPLNMESNLIQSLDLNLGDKTPTAQRPMDLPPFIEKMEVNDVLSPDQEPDLTFTVEEKTCVTVQLNSLKAKNDHDKEDERISEISEPDLVSTSSAPDRLLKTEDDDDLTSIEEDLPEEMCGPCTDIVETIILPDSSDTSSSSETTPKAEDNILQDGNKKEDDTTSNDKQTNNSSDTPAIVVDDSVTNSSNDLNSSPPYRDENVDFLNSEVKYSSQQQQQQTFDKKPAKNSGLPVVVKTVTKAIVSDVHNGNTTNIDIINGADADYWDICDKIYHETTKEKSNTTSALDSINLLLNKHRENNYVISEIDFESIGEGPLIGLNLSGEEDPWVATDIRVAAPCQDIMSTSFQMNEWESEEEDSNSSEEFMYMYVRNKESKSDKGYTEINLKNRHSPVPQPKTPEQEQMNSLDNGAVKKDELWSPHKDQIPVIGESEDVPIPNESDSDSEDEEGEFVPSSWDSMALPVRSALKSPDKVLDEEPKKRRNVVFKVQRYHSVYEYPKESVELSPALSEPQLWNQTFENFIESQKKDTPTPQDPDDPLFNDGIDGFMISSSTRPFSHSGSQFHTQCNTWPGDQNDFSWSQIQDIEDQTAANSDSKMFQGSSYIEWPKHLLSTCSNTVNNTSIDSGDRSDSGVGESVEFNNPDSLALGELRHARATLKLPLGSISVSPVAITDTETEDESTNSPNSQIQVFEEDPIVVKAIHTTDLDEKEALLLDADTILPTPSCTGSMDSLSSSNSSLSGSDHRSKSPDSNTIRRADRHITDEQALNLVTEVMAKQCTTDFLNLTNSKLGRNLSARLSDSTDEDSGIENLTRISK